MTTIKFPKTYAESRREFRKAAREAGARIKTYVLRDEKGRKILGPNGETLTTDIAYLGDPNAKKVLFTESGRHGAEGRVGAALQIDFFRRRKLRPGSKKARLPKGVRAVAVHAINPYGMAYDTRGNEKGVDENRVYRDNYEMSEADKKPAIYNEVLNLNGDLVPLNEVMVPRSLSKKSIERTDAAVNKIWDEKGGAFVAGIMRGQYFDPRGIIYGGTEPSWSFNLWKKTAGTKVLKNAKGETSEEIIHKDIHSALEIPGADPGEPQYLLLTTTGSPVHAIARAIWQSETKLKSGQKPVDVKCLLSGDSASAIVTGAACGYWPQLIEQQDLKGPPPVVIPVGVEFSVRKGMTFRQVIRAKRLRQALFVHKGSPISRARQKEIIDAMRDAFCPDDPAWQAIVMREGRRGQRLALEYLAKN